jgi:hypothetical protein
VYKYNINGKDIYFCVYDDLSNQHSIGYGYSIDGVNWTGKTLDLTGYVSWAHNNDFTSSLRTPCSLIQESDGTFTIIFTAFGPGPGNYNMYAQVGRLNVRIEEIEKLSNKNAVFPGDMRDWKSSGGTAGVQYGREYSLDGRTAPSNSVYTAETYSDATIEASLRYVDQIWNYTTAKAGVYTRADANGEGGYRAYLTSDNKVQLYAGNILLAEKDTDLRPAIFRKLTLSVMGNNIKVYYEGMLYINITNDDYTDAGYVGLYAAQSHWHYERVGVKSSEIEFLSVTTSAFVTKTTGRTNLLTGIVTEKFKDGSTNVISATFIIENNSEGTFKIGGYKVYVNTKGNDQIRECRITE